LWIGTMRGGLNRLDTKSGEVTVFQNDASDPASLAANGVMAIFEDSTGNVWAGTYGGGANRFDKTSGSFTRFLPVDGDATSISSTRVRAFAEDASGKLWMATDAGGLNLFDPATETFTHFRHDAFDPTTLADDTIYSLDVGADGTLWVGTQGGGLDRVVGSAAVPGEIRFENISQADGLTNNVIYGLEVDTNGVVWVSTAYGISRYNPFTGDIRNMHRSDGLQSEEFHSGAHYQSESGELFFGGPNGYNSFRPDQLVAANVVPLVMLTGVFLGNDPIKADKPIDDKEGLTIDYKQDSVSFEFAALDYTASERNQYRYKL
ncbi:MAG: two-component regulator propeller domain-containing protein, partial [Pseudomonadota bacterium]